MTSQAIELRGVRVVRGGRTTLEIGELTVGSGELVAVVGPNGSGKSTLLQIVNGLLPAARGELNVLGERLHRRAALGIRRRCALVFQDPLLLHETVFDNVALAPRFRRYARKRVDEQVERALRAFRCEHLASRPAHQLSGGEIQRVCLARALVCDPELVMLDEPFTALDSPTRSALVQELRQIAVDRGTTVVLVTHDFDDVLSFADRAIVLRDGRLIQDAPPEQVLRKPVDDVVARLVSMDNIIACETEPVEGGTRVQLSNGLAFRVPGQTSSGKTSCCLAGDALTLDAPPESAETSMEGQVAHVVPGLGLHRVTVNCDGVPVVARVARDRAGSLQTGQRVRVAFDPACVHLV
jgi:tungstate transport system ATP-binding protein